MKCRGLLSVFWCSSILAVTSCIRVDGYSCVTSYWKTITCVLNIPVHPVEQANTTYSLRFIQIKNDKTTTCPLVLNQSYSCVCEVTQIDLSDYMKYSIQLCNESACLLLDREFNPLMNIQLTPPSEVEFQQTPENFTITWKSGYESHRYLNSYLEYELLLQKDQGGWNKTLISTEESLTLPSSQFDAHATYCVAVRSQPSKNFGSKGIWSKWSPMKCYENDVPEEENTPVILTKFLGAVCAVAVVLLFVFYSPATRMKIKALSHTPSPASFFQPLYQQHEGVFQKWLSPKGNSVQTYKTEDITITDSVTVVPRPVTKDPEENQDFHNPSVTPLVFSQCQSSYVGLPGMHVVSHPITMVCPRDTSYTQLPTSVLGFSIGEVKAVSSPPEDSLEISHADSGCSCEDLTQSPECSLPSSPVVASSPPCYCTDYCILNKTAEGVVPVLVSK